MKQFAYAVLIGRFQPFHLGHGALFARALEIADRVVLVVGSHKAPRSIRNPWSAEERQALIAHAIGPDAPVDFLYVPDSAYNFNDWIISVRRGVNIRTRNEQVALVGHYKDDTSYYLDYFPDWQVQALPKQADGISSTEIRTAFFDDMPLNAKAHLHPNIYADLLGWVETPSYLELREEYRFIKDYRKKWEGSPYPPTFVTADAVVFALGHVLLVRRRLNPGKGKLAFPGGFIKARESIETACLRELKAETGIDLSPAVLRSSLKLREVFDHPSRDPRGRVITHVFMFEPGLKTLPAVTGGDEAAEAFWFPLYRLEDEEDHFFNDHAQILKYFVNRMK